MTNDTVNDNSILLRKDIFFCCDFLHKRCLKLTYYTTCESAVLTD